MKRILKSIAVLSAALLILSGCGAAQNTAESAAVPASAVTQTSAETAGRPDAAARDWEGDDKDGVALYLEEYRKLPDNYITKKEARKLGWEGGALHLTVPGRCIGGDEFGNYEGLLPEDKTYQECDIDTLDSDSRGVKRIIYSIEGSDLDIWYTKDHYESFDLIYGDGQ